MKYKLFYLIFLLYSCAFVGAQNRTDFVTIRGHITDYDNNPLDSVSVFWMKKDFSDIKEVITNEDGYYEAKIKKGHYYSMGALNMSTYIVTGSKLPEDDMRLEFWGWNFIADRDTTFNMQYHRMEVYGLNPFRIQGATPGYTIYCRPMSLTRTLAYNRKKTPHAALAPDPEKMEVKVTINNEEVSVKMKQKVVEYFGEKETGDAYLLFVDLPKGKNDFSYNVFRVQITDLENGDKGEATYFLEKKEYVE